MHPNDLLLSQLTSMTHQPANHRRMSSRWWCVIVVAILVVSSWCEYLTQVDAAAAAAAAFLSYPSSHRRHNKFMPPLTWHGGMDSRNRNNHRLQQQDPNDIVGGRNCPNIKQDVVPLPDGPYLFRARRNILSTIWNIGTGGLMVLSAADFTCVDAAAAVEENESFASLAERANKMSREMDAVNPLSLRLADSTIRPTNQTVYDFTLPVSGVTTPFKDIIRQEFNTKRVTIATNNETMTYQDAKVKAIIVVNMKQDDPVARKTIPELMALAAKYGRGSDYELAIVACPTDQGYYEPDTSQLLKLKVASEYGYGINPSTVVTDKVNMLGTGAVPLWRWLQNVCRTPSGLGRLQGNFEKFLIDGRTGLPVRRYPRKYRPLNMMEDIEAVLAGRPLPPAQAGFFEEWRMAIADSERDTYRFEKGLNVFDQ
jgi:glutathione peroxidase-family protein